EQHYVIDGGFLCSKESTGSTAIDPGDLTRSIGIDVYPLGSVFQRDHVVRTENARILRTGTGADLRKEVYGRLLANGELGSPASQRPGIALLAG
ncbi:hypothetical protein PSYPI_42035, partial [Pseudomonas syringae pv. pisi str. 1704B]